MNAPEDRTRTAPVDPARATATAQPAPPPADACEHTQVQQSAPAHLFEPSGLPTIPGYVALREIARGGMGVVFAARDLAFDRDVAVKVMHAGQDAARFVVESKVTAQLPHPGVPPVYALGTLADGRPFLAMKLVEGRTLADILAPSMEGAAPRLPQLLGHFEQICLTVGFAHSRGIVHRDLKPSNVMVGAFGEVLVMDWGLAKSGAGGDATAGAALAPEAEGALATRAGQVKGTPAYMAPEQARGEPVDARADVFALGGILSAVLTGAPPFWGESVIHTVMMAARAELRECFEKLDVCGTDAELAAVAKRCLATNPGDRFTDGAAVAAAVTAYRASVEDRLRRAERERAASEAESREQRKRRKVQLALAAALLLLVIGLGAAAWWQDRQAGERRLKAQQARDGVAAARKLAEELRKQYKFKAADAVLAQAAAATGSDAPELVGDVEQARADLAFVVLLDDIRYRKWVWVTGPDGKVDYERERTAPPRYRQAFADRRLDLESLRATEAAGRIAASPVKADIVAAVDDWALYEPNELVRNRLLEVARLAAPDPWTDRLRTPAVWKDKRALEQLAAEINRVNAPASSVTALATLMQRNGLDPGAILAAAHFKNPSDYELAFALAMWHGDLSDGLDFGPLEAALALRPDNTYVMLIIGSTLDAFYDDVDGALAAYQRVIDLEPGMAIAHANKGGLLATKMGDVPGGIAELRLAITFDPTEDTHHGVLGEILLKAGDVAGARAELTTAAQYSHRRWGAKLAKLPPPLAVAPPPRELNPESRGGP